MVAVAAGGLLLAAAFGLVYLHVVLAQRQFQLDALSTRVTQEQSSYLALRLQVAQLDSPQEIISTAEGRLGMRQPASVTYLTPPSGTESSNGPLVSGLGVTPTGKVIVAPSGDANWPRIKADLAGSP